MIARAVGAPFSHVLVPPIQIQGVQLMLAKLLVKLSSVVAISSACGVWKVW